MTGHISPQPILTTRSAHSRSARSSWRGTCPEMSMPSSCITATTFGPVRTAGRVPAERSSYLSPPPRLKKASAIGERPALPTQTKRTFTVGSSPFSPPRRGARSRRLIRRRLVYGAHHMVADSLQRRSPEARPALSRRRHTYAGEMRSDRSTAKNVLALTFDDGPSEWTPRILDLLAEHHARATLFILGDG